MPEVQEVYVTPEEMRVAGRNPKDASRARTTEVLRDEFGRTIPAGARVRLIYLRRKNYTIRWDKDGSTTITVPNVHESKLTFLLKYA